MPTNITACQVPDIRGDIDSSLNWIEKFTVDSIKYQVSLILFPECFLQGYLTEIAPAKRFALDIHSPEFETILNQLKRHDPVIVFGMIEKENECLYNTAVVIKHGVVIGKYRKTHLLPGEKIFSPGNDYPVFVLNELKFGINICYDTQFAEPIAELSKQSAKLILCPSNNMMRYETAEKYKDEHHWVRIQRVKENKIWLVSSDVTGERDGRIAYGPTSAIDYNGNIVAQVPLMETGMIVVEI